MTRQTANVSTNHLLILISASGLLQAVGVVLTAWQVVAVLAGRTNKLLLSLSGALLKISGTVLFPFVGITSAVSLVMNEGRAEVIPETSQVEATADEPTALINGRPTNQDVAWVPVIALGVICALVGVGLGSWAAAATL